MRSGIDGKFVASAFDTPGAVVGCATAAFAVPVVPPPATAGGAASAPFVSTIVPVWLNVGDAVFPPVPTARAATPRTNTPAIPHRAHLAAFCVITRLLVGS